MSDDSNAFVNAYKEAFGGASSGTQHILCSRHVKRSWNRRLDVDVKDPEKREIMKQYLNKIPRPPFESLLPVFIQNAAISFLLLLVLGGLSRTLPWYGALSRIKQTFSLLARSLGMTFSSHSSKTSAVIDRFFHINIV
ncbi:hypothetical protein QR680_012553 [Steinernema hermaphroditum]|uniref:MULE transposase domain-containing protein n=1 Tax=Steinernema hermaphroditum TaxID=289476 RepID=A0AA39I3Y6_9BILA|nr:hypothetical protein QR680_012553 [Steinernema hermaphroditum]